MDGSSKGNGIVRFSDQTDQQMALLEMHKQKVHGIPMILKLGHAKVLVFPENRPLGIPTTHESASSR